MNGQVNIRPECLRPAQTWEQPTGEEVRELLRHAQLTGAQAAHLLGMKGPTGRGIRRYTGGDAPIPYPSWAMLCEVAGLGLIWRAAANREELASQGPEHETIDPDRVSDTSVSLMPAFDDAEQIINATWSGTLEASVANVARCRDALVRMRQIVHALGLPNDTASPDLAQLDARITAARNRLTVILGWADFT